MLDANGNDTGDSWGWSHLVSGGFVEYVDTEEEETTLIAMTMKDLALQREAVSVVPCAACKRKCNCIGGVSS